MTLAICLNCNSPLPPSANFCTQCGVTAARACPRCAALHAVGATFCANCGLPLNPTEGPFGRPPAVSAAGYPAGFLIRLAAYLIDYAVLQVPTWAISAGWMIWFFNSDFFDRIEQDPEPSEIVTLMVMWMSLYVLMFALLFAYHYVQLAFFGTTIGKRVLNLWVVDESGRKPSPGRLLVRQLIHAIEAIVSVIFIVVAVRQDKRALHDVASGTYVIKR